MKSKTEIQNECFDIIKPLRRCGAAVTMGVGKTLIGLRHMADNYNEYSRFLVVAPKLAVLDEWVAEANKHKYDYLVEHMTFTTYRSLLKQDTDFDVVYLDECHSLKESHDSWLSAYENKILGLTGTPPKYSRSEKGRMVNKYCPIVYTYIADDAVLDGILNDYHILVHKLNLNETRSFPITKNGKTWFTSEKTSYNYWCDRIDAAVYPKELAMMRIMRMKTLMEFPSKENYAKVLLNTSQVKTLLFANTQSQADRVCKDSYHSGNSKNSDKLDKFKAGTITKLSSVLQLAEGVNIPDLEVGIIMHAYGNERKAAQRIGRMMRLNPDKLSLIHILCYGNTIDETWVRDALEGFDPAKITWKEVKVS